VSERCVKSTLKCNSATNGCKDTLYEPSNDTRTEYHLNPQFNISCVLGERHNCCNRHGYCQAEENYERVKYMNGAIPVILSALGVSGSSRLLTSISNNKIYACKQASKLSRLVCAVFAAWCVCLSPVLDLFERFLFFRNDHDHEQQEKAQQTFPRPALTTLFRAQGAMAIVYKRMKPASTVFCPIRRVFNTVTFLSVLCTGCAGASSPPPHNRTITLTLI
jgi:hypothetical protein